MQDTLFDTPEKIKHAVQSFTNLLEHAGWKLVEAIMNENIQVVQSQLENGIGEDEKPEDIKVLREKLKIMREMRDTPMAMLTKLEAIESEEKTYDPFETAEDIKRRRDRMPGALDK